MTDLLPPRTVADLVAITGLDKDTVKAAIRAGELPGYYVQRPGSTRGRYTIPGDAFESFRLGQWTPIHHTVLRETPRASPTANDMRRKRTSSDA